MKTNQPRIVLVTGSSRGIGRSIALELAAQGWTVVIHGSRRSPELKATLREANKRSPASVAVAANLDNETAIHRMFEKIDRTFGRLDALVNNAAFQIPSALVKLKAEDWDLVLKVNLKAPFLCAQEAVKRMRRLGGGKVVNISSVHALVPRRNFAHYSSSKGGLEILSKCLALELAPHNIQVNSLVLGAFATEKTSPARQKKLISAIPAGRIGATEEIGRLVAFLCSNACDYMTGASITIDGGLTLGFCASRPDL